MTLVNGMYILDLDDKKVYNINMKRLWLIIWIPLLFGIIT
jgi:hypothetical protein